MSFASIKFFLLIQNNIVHCLDAFNVREHSWDIEKKIHGNYQLFIDLLEEMFTNTYLNTQANIVY